MEEPLRCLDAADPAVRPVRRQTPRGRSASSLHKSGAHGYSRRPTAISACNAVCLAGRSSFARKRKGRWMFISSFPSLLFSRALCFPFLPVCVLFDFLLSLFLAPVSVSHCPLDDGKRPRVVPLSTRLGARCPIRLCPVTRLLPRRWQYSR
jgi:hypothetical protein